MSGDQAYPIPAPEDDPRFNLGFLIDVIKVLTHHGFPPIEGGPDYVRLQQALFTFIYGKPEATR
jgi:hypothetical protein